MLLAATAKWKNLKWKNLNQKLQNDDNNSNNNNNKSKLKKKKFDTKETKKGIIKYINDSIYKRQKLFL